MKTLLLMVLLFVAACGTNDGQDGTNGRDGQSAKCKVEARSGKEYLRCLNADGSESESEIVRGSDGKPGVDGAPGKPGQNAVMGSSTCYADFNSYKINYNVLYLVDGSLIASLNYKHYTGNIEDYPNEFAAIYTKATQGFESAKLENNLWAATLSGKDKAKVTYKPLSQSKDVVCTYSHD